MVSAATIGRMQNMLQDEVDMASFAGIVAELRSAGVSGGQFASPADSLASPQIPGIAAPARQTGFEPPNF